MTVLNMRIKRNLILADNLPVYCYIILLQKTTMSFIGKFLGKTLKKKVFLFEFFLFVCLF